MVRNVDEAVVRELKKRAARRNHSAEQEHREILEQALLRHRRRSLAEVLAAMPDAGRDADFERADWCRRPEALYVDRTGPSSYVDGTRAPAPARNSSRSALWASADARAGG